MTPLAGHPTEIGPYKVLDVLGVGGVGAVYLAEQSEPLRRRVAIKIIQLGRDTSEVLARFSLESQALALMSHPNIASVYETGETVTKRPYFVMEYVPGEPLTQHCDTHRLDVRERLRLFVTVCRGVQHAHQKGIIHRDLKPTNIIVRVEDGQHVPVIIDFGLAKAVGDADDGAAVTRQGQLLGTPQYMSPEQIQSRLEDVDSRADVYALGVLLFELIVGVRPHDRELTPEGLPKLLASMDREESTRPSTRLSELQAEAVGIAERRRTSREELLKELRGDLDWIALKALDADPEQRYASAAALADDVERYLRREPILARPSSRRYVLQRFLARNRLELTAAAFVVLAMLIGSAASTFLHLRAGVARSDIAAVVRLCEAIRSDASNAHLWFEEALADDQSLDLERDVFAPLREAADGVEIVQTGGRMPWGEVRPVRSEVARGHLSELRRQLDGFARLTEERWAKRDAEGRTGEPLDQRYDAVYERILGLCDDIADELQANANDDWERTARAAIAANVLTVLGVVFALVVALRTWARRSA